MSANRVGGRISPAACTRSALAKKRWRDKQRIKRQAKQKTLRNCQWPVRTKDRLAESYGNRDLGTKGDMSVKTQNRWMLSEPGIESEPARRSLAIGLFGYHPKWNELQIRMIPYY